MIAKKKLFKLKWSNQENPINNCCHNSPIISWGENIAYKRKNLYCRNFKQLISIRPMGALPCDFFIKFSDKKFIKILKKLQY